MRNYNTVDLSITPVQYLNGNITRPQCSTEHCREGRELILLDSEADALIHSGAKLTRLEPTDESGEKSPIGEVARYRLDEDCANLIDGQCVAYTYGMESPVMPNTCSEKIMGSISCREAQVSPVDEDVFDVLEV